MAKNNNKKRYELHVTRGLLEARLAFINEQIRQADEILPERNLMLDSICDEDEKYFIGYLNNTFLFENDPDEDPTVTGINR